MYCVPIRVSLCCLGLVPLRSSRRRKLIRRSRLCCARGAALASRSDRSYLDCRKSPQPVPGAPLNRWSAASGARLRSHWVGLCSQSNRVVCQFWSSIAQNCCDRPSISGQKKGARQGRKSDAPYADAYPNRSISLPVRAANLCLPAKQLALTANLIGRNCFRPFDLSRARPATQRMPHPAFQDLLLWLGVLVCVAGPG